ncbi:MAG: cupredoxin domain-containing protein [Nitrosotalea sp.]
MTCNFYSIYIKNKTILIISVFFVTILFVIGSNQAAFAENKTVTIPLGAANPNFDTPAIEWFSPSVITVNAGDTVTWVNNDKEIHNITSGNGITRAEFVTTSHVGTPDGLFQSGSFSPGQSWSHTFTKSGIFHYFCSIHPWMNGVVVVSKQIPNTPTDSTGKPITKWPIKAYTQDQQYEEDLTWEPHVILTGEKITFVFQFYGGSDYYKLMPRMPYEFVIMENGKELYRASGQTQIGGDYMSFVFKEPGTATFMFDNIGGEGISTEYSSIVYQNPNQTNANIPVVQPARNIGLGQELAIILVAPPIVIFLVVILSLKGVFSKKSVNKEESHEQKRTPV